MAKKDGSEGFGGIFVGLFFLLLILHFFFDGITWGWVFGGSLIGAFVLALVNKMDL